MMKMQRILGKGVISMTREEILEKSRKENQTGDEREQATVLRGGSIAKAVGLALCMLMVFLGDVLGADPAAGLGAFAIYWGMYGTDRLYRWLKLRERFDLLLAIGAGQIARIFILPMMAYRATIAIKKVSYPVMEAPQFAWVVLCLILSAVCCLALVFFWLYANKSKKVRAWLAKKLFV